MKKATKLAMIGSGIILLIEILYKIMYFLDFQINQQFYQIISFFQMIAPITIFNFFVILYKKQTNIINKVTFSYMALHQNLIIMQCCYLLYGILLKDFYV